MTHPSSIQTWIWTPIDTRLPGSQTPTPICSWRPGRWYLSDWFNLKDLGFLWIFVAKEREKTQKQKSQILTNSQQFSPNSGLDRRNCPQNSTGSRCCSISHLGIELLHQRIQTCLGPMHNQFQQKNNRRQTFHTSPEDERTYQLWKMLLQSTHQLL